MSGFLSAGIVGGPDIPDSVEYNWSAEDFASPWPNAVGEADMTVSGLATSTFSNGETSVSGDGDGYGFSSAEELGDLETWGFAFTISASSADVGDGDVVAGKVDNDSNDIFYFGTQGENCRFFWRIDDNSVVVDGGTIIDGSVTPVVVNKTGDGSGDIEIYTGDMSTDTSTIEQDEGPLNHTDNNLSGLDWGFWARNDGLGGVERTIQADIGVFEFNTSPYTLTEREGFVGRRPEV